MTYAELIQLYYERSNALQWYWTLYVIVIGGLLAFSSLRKQRDRLTTALVTVLYCFFAYKNLGAIQDSTLQRAATLQALKADQTRSTAATARVASLLEPTLLSPDPGEIRKFHVTCDVLTVAALWAMELRRKRAAAAEHQVN